MSQEGIGICIGASTVTVVDNGDEFRCLQARHAGDPRHTVSELLSRVAPKVGRSVMATGRGVRATLGYSHVSEPVAVQRALDEFSRADLPDAVVSFGGQSILVYEIDPRGGIANAHTFNKCGSGTGEFFLQQVKRLGFDGADDALAAATKDEARTRPYVPASRCSVFCKSDCTHATNDGKATPGQIVAGLCRMISGRIGQLLAKIKAKRVWVIGGGGRNEPVLDCLREAGFDATVPPHAMHFEAWGASLLAKEAGAPNEQRSDARASFQRLPPLTEFSSMVEFREVPKALARPGDVCLLAVDAGSTTTKLVLMRLEDLAVVGSYYGYTLGRPHVATHEGLAVLQEQLGGVPVEIGGIVATGSGRYLVETFLTDYARSDKTGSLKQQVAAVNEITCHAKASAHFNPGVACVLEIGGQDAKYTYLVNGVPTDFCMNEACSAGTGSFLAEVVKEMFRIERPEDIAPLAKTGRAPIRFGEQCSAFIEGDINIALQEGASKADVVAGLCYSICYNYINRVVGSRPIRGPISVQGGTAYNEAFCLAMAGVLKMNGILGDGDKIVVSRDAGLMGAIGAGFELAERIGRGEFAQFRTDIDALLAKRLTEGRSFQCQACDYHCSIQSFIVDGHKVPFGGFCRRYDNVRRRQKSVEPSEFDLTIRRDELLFTEHLDRGRTLPADAPSVGVLGTFFDLTYLPFLSHLFYRLGCRVELAKAVDESGRERQGAAFCWPVEQAHGLLANLLSANLDYYWLPHIKAVAIENAGDTTRHCCPFIQGSPYYLPAAFPELPRERLLAPYLDLSRPLEDITEQLQPLGQRLGVNEQTLRSAVTDAWKSQQEFWHAGLDEGRRVLEWLEEDPSRMAIVLVGRPYNALSGHLGANKGLSRKLAAAGVPVIPLDFLPLANEEPEAGMYWAAGQLILKGARLIARHEQLFGVCLTNFSCGPDSFVLHRFREYMGSKPSLTLEFDGHTVNAGFDTRAEAFLDVVKAWRDGFERRANASAIGRPARAMKRLPHAKIVFPDMGAYNTEAIAAATVSLGIPSVALAPADECCMQLGRRYSSCKECLPYHAVLGSMLRYAQERTDSEPTSFFMIDGSGPCRLGQYKHFAGRVLDDIGFENVRIATLSDKGSYGELGPEFRERAYIAMATAGVMAKVADAAIALAIDREQAEGTVRRCWTRILDALRRGVTWKNFFFYHRLLGTVAAELKTIPLRMPYSEAPKILITGEIYVRLTDIATRSLKERLSRDGLVPVQTTATEFPRFEDLIHLKKLNADYEPLGLRATFACRVQMLAEDTYERLIMGALGESGLTDGHVDHLSEILRAAQPHISPLLAGEAILTVGGTLDSVLERFAGAVVIGPFGCMPTRMASGILAYTTTVEEKRRLRQNDPRFAELGKEISRGPVLFYEADGAPMPPILESQMEVFSLVAHKTWTAMRKAGLQKGSAWH